MCNLVSRAIVDRVLNKFLSSVLEPLGGDDLHIGLGSLTLNNIKLNSSFLKSCSLNLPVKLSEASVSRITIKVDCLTSCRGHL